MGNEKNLTLIEFWEHHINTFRQNSLEISCPECQVFSLVQDWEWKAFFPSGPKFSCPRCSGLFRGDITEGYMVRDSNITDYKYLILEIRQVRDNLTRIHNSLYDARIAVEYSNLKPEVKAFLIELIREKKVINANLVDLNEKERVELNYRRGKKS